MKKHLKLLPALIVLAGVLLIIPQSAAAATPDAEIKLRPHCESSICMDYPLYDAETYITYGLSEGEMLDMDIVLKNPSGQSIQSVQSWLEYDPKILKGVDIRVSDSFPLIAPGEQTFAEGSNRVKIGASNVSGGVTESEIVFARVQFQVLKEVEDIASVKFHEFSLLGQEGKTKVLMVEEGRVVNILKTRPNDLRLYFGEDPPPGALPGTLPPGSLPPGTLPPGTTPPGTTPPGTLPLGTTPPGTVPPGTTPPGAGQPPVITDPGFALLQPQGLRVMTGEDMVYLIWNKLDDKRVIGYNIYYGTVPGRYIQRRTVSTATTGVTISKLTVGERYFFAVTAFNASGQDSEYSFEAAVTVGDPTSSTAPFTLTDGGGDSPIGGSVIGSGTDHVPGGTGMPIAALFGAIAASAGATFLIRRHFVRASAQRRLHLRPGSG